MSDPHILLLLDRVRAIAQLGLNYAQNSFDRARYQQLLELAALQYEQIGNIPADQVMSRFQKELGYVTSKVGVNGALFSESGELFLTRRSDDSCWEMPGGWVDAGESPEHAIEREMLEETSSLVKAQQIIDVFSRLPGDFSQPHSSCHLVYFLTGTASLDQYSSEVIDCGFFRSLDTLEWHRDHRRMAEAAQRFYARLAST